MRTGRRSSPLAAVAITVAAACGAATVAAAPPPAGRTYFTVFLGLDAPYAQNADCLRFTGDALCTSSRLCGTWAPAEPGGRATAVAFGFAFEDDGVRVEIDGRAEINASGKRDSFAATAAMSAGGERFNFGFAGRSTEPRNCLRLWADFCRRNPPHQGEQEPACLARAAFVDLAASDYLLPFPVGKEYRVSQTYCFQGAGHADQLAYDFATPIGSQVLAARGGVVRAARQNLPDDGGAAGPGEHNHVYIEHDDGTVGFYAHLQQNSVRVRVGDRVEAGQPIARNGFSGDIDAPHLHFGVYRDWPVQEGRDVAVSFRNAMGPLDGRGGLYSGVFYRATPVGAGR